MSSGGAIGSGATATIATTSGMRQIVYGVKMVAATITTAKFGGLGKGTGRSWGDVLDGFPSCGHFWRLDRDEFSDVVGRF